MSSAKDQIDRASRRANARDSKRRRRMKVSGKAVFDLARLLRDPAKRKR